MSIFKSIREKLSMTQAAIGEAIGVTQGNVSFYERGQTIPPAVAGKLIGVARTMGLPLSFDQIYGSEPLPDPVRPCIDVAAPVADQAEAAHAGAACADVAGG